MPVPTNDSKNNNGKSMIHNFVQEEEREYLRLLLNTEGAAIIKNMGTLSALCLNLLENLLKCEDNRSSCQHG